MDENRNSLSVVKTLVSFVGFNPDLVIEFLRPYINKRVKSVEKIILFSSKDSRNPLTDNKAEGVMRQVKTFIIANAANVKITEVFMKNMWDLREYRSKLLETAAIDASINLTAGPAIFSLAGMLWAIENNHFIEHSIESTLPLVGKSIVFNKIDLNPFMKTIFSVDETDRLIIGYVRRFSRTTVEIKEYVESEARLHLTLRTIENRLKRLEKMKIVSIVRGKVNKIYLSEELKKLQ